MAPRDGKNVPTVRLGVLYDCEEMCGRTAKDAGRMKDRAACRCSLPGFDPQRWDPAASPDAAADAELRADTMQCQAQSRGIALDFDLDRDGCPWGWVVSRFPASVMVYTGTRGSDSPVRSQNLRLLGRVLRDPEPPNRLLEHVAHAETLEDAAYSHYHREAASL